MSWSVGIQKRPNRDHELFRSLKGYVCLGLLVPLSPIKAEDPLSRNHTRFVATLTAKAIKQLNKAGINDFEKHFKGKTVRVTGPISRSDYDGLGSPPEVEIVIDDLSQLDVVK